MLYLNALYISNFNRDLNALVSPHAGHENPKVDFIIQFAFIQYTSKAKYMEKMIRSINIAIFYPTF